MSLPCGDSICEKHLNDTNLVRQNQIKCLECAQEFVIIDTEFKPNATLSHEILDIELYLNEDEKSLKRELKEKLIKIDQLQDEFVQNKNDLLNACFDYFQEMRGKIDLHREETKQHLSDNDLENL